MIPSVRFIDSEGLHQSPSARRGKCSGEAEARVESRGEKESLPEQGRTKGGGGTQGTGKKARGANETCDENRSGAQGAGEKTEITGQIRGEIKSEWKKTLMTSPIIRWRAYL